MQINYETFSFMKALIVVRREIFINVVFEVEGSKLELLKKATNCIN